MNFIKKLFETQKARAIVVIIIFFIIVNLLLIFGVGAPILFLLGIWGALIITIGLACLAGDWITNGK
jgi:hypothetical protein